MRVHDWTYLLAATGHMTLAVLALVRGRWSAVARPLALLCLAMFGWCMTSLASSVAHIAASKYLDGFFTALCPPLTLDLAAAFVGARRAWARVIVVAYVGFGALALSCLAGIGSAWGWRWVNGAAWAAAFLSGWIPILFFIVWLLIRHLIISGEPDEKARTRTMLAALAVGGAFATFDLFTVFDDSMPNLAPIGTLAGTLLVGIAVFRFRLFDRDLSSSAAIYTASLALAAIVSYLAAARVFGSNVALLVASTAAVTLGLGAAALEIMSSISAQRARVERLASLGRFSSQLAHDLKNPIAALKGSLQFLGEERARGNGLDAHAEFLGLMLDQVERLGRIVDGYERVGRVEPAQRTVDVNEIVRGVVALEAFASQTKISVHADLDEGVPHCELDADLVQGALENVIRNAFEAMPGGGGVVVRTALDPPDTPRQVVISVEDDGDGMDARVAERAFDDFFTTKAEGTGRGLAFVRRVAHAHGGGVSLRTVRGKGTVVQMRFPMATKEIRGGR